MIGLRYQDIIPNLNSSHSANLYYSDGKKFSGSFHIHLNDSTAMSGATHTEDSQELYYMRVGERLTPTKNPSHIPQALNRKRRNTPKAKMRKLNKDGSRVNPRFPNKRNKPINKGGY